MAVKNKKILITGGAGFVGANFVRAFLELGHEVTVVEKEGTDLWRLSDVKKRINLQYVDLLDYETLEAFMVGLNPAVILHFATYGAYQGRQQDIQATINTNLLGTINLVNACSKIKFECFINTGSSSEYGVKPKSMKETDVLEPNNVYGITKAAATLYCQDMAKKLNLPIVTVRLFSPYGSFEDKGRLVPSIILACLKNSRLELSRPQSVRDFIFMEDVVNAYLCIIKQAKKARGQIFNVGSGNQHSVAEMVALVKKITGSKIKPQYGQVKKVHTEPKMWQADISKTKKILGFKPAHHLQQGLAKNIAWFKENLSLYEKS